MKPPLLFLHGVTRRGQSAAPLLPALTLAYDVFMPDFPGHGNSPRRPGRYRLVDQAESAQNFLEGLDREPAVVYGHSMGAMVAAAVAADIPSRVKAVILEDPPFDTMGARIHESALYSYFSGFRRFAGDIRPVTELARELADFRYGPPGAEAATRLGDERDAAALRFTARCMQLLDPDVFTPILDGTWLEGYNTHAIFERIQCPVLLLQADPTAGGMLTDGDAAIVTNICKDVTHLKFPGGPHNLHWMETDKTLRAVMNFLSSLY